MAGFDWNKYQKDEGQDDSGFDWNKHEKVLPDVSEFESGARGLVQAGTMGFADEAEGGVRALLEKVKGNPEEFNKLYSKLRDESRKSYKEAEEVNPKAYFGGEMAGNVGTMFIPGLNVAKGAKLASIAGKAALQGGISAAGNTENDLTSMEGLKDVGAGTLVGAGAGYLGDKAGKAVGAGFNKVSSMIPKGTALKEGTEKLAAKAGKVLTGVDDQNLLHYAKNTERVKKAPTVEGIKDTVDELVGKTSDKLKSAKEASSLAKQNLDEAYKANVFDLSKKNAPTEVADNLIQAIDNQKSVLGSLSDEADDVLAKSGETFKKKDLVDFVDKLGASVGAGKEKALIGDEAVSAVNKLKVMRDRIDQGLGDEIDAVTLRDVLRQVRKDINYNQNAGEFNDTLNNLKTNFTKNVSDVLKGKSPEYKSYMDKMSDISQNLEQMSKNFGTKDKAVAALNSLPASKSDSKSQLLSKFGELTEKDWHGDLGEFRKAKELLDMTKRQDMRKQLNPDLYENYQKSLGNIDLAQSELEPIGRLSRDSTQNAIRQQGFKTPNIENRRAFEEAGKRLNKDLLGEMKDRAVLDSFEKEGTQGSRRALMFGSGGAALGGAIAGPVGAGIGGSIGTGIGGAMDVYGGRLAKKAIESPMIRATASKIGSMIESTPDVFGKYAPILQEAARKGTQSLALTYYLLQKKDPEFGNMMNQINSQGE